MGLLKIAQLPFSCSSGFRGQLRMSCASLCLSARCVATWRPHISHQTCRSTHGAACTVGMPEVTRSAGRNLLLCSLSLFLVPLSLFFVVYKGGLDFVLIRLVKGDVTSYARAVTGAVLAVLCVNTVLVAFVLTAFKETPEEVAKKED